MSIVDPLESVAMQVARARLSDAEHARLARSIRHRQQPRSTRRSAASVLRHLAARIEPEGPCLDT